MGRKREFEIKESLAELKNYIPKVRGYKPSKRLESLILIKSEQYKKLEEVATHLGVTRKTLLNWIKEYKQGGVDLLLSPAKRNRPSKLITPEIHEELEKRLLSEKNPFSSYVEVKEWLLKQYGVEIEYQWLWKYMRTKFKSVLKVPRKTNVKKNPDAEADFFKTANGAGRG